MNFRVHFRIPPANGDAPKVAQGCRTPKLAVGVARNPSRQRLGVRLSSAALTPVDWQADFLEDRENSKLSTSFFRQAGRQRILIEGLRSGRGGSGS